MRERDPENRLLARGPRLRLPAEMIRDQALAVSGLLSDKMGGPSVKPYQPDGLWEQLSAFQGRKLFERSKGADLWRRSVYSYLEAHRAAAFDDHLRRADARILRRAPPVSSTPLQALALLNDEMYIETARKLAERMMKEGGAIARSRSALARLPPGHGAHAVGHRARGARRRPEPAPRAVSQAIARAAEKLLTAGEVAARSGARRRRNWRPTPRRQRDPESGRGDHAPMNPLRERELMLTRRQLFGRAATGIGTAALGSLLAPPRIQPPRACPASPTSRRKPNASSICTNPARLRRWTCSTPSRNWPSASARICPDSIRQRPAAHRHDVEPEDVSRWRPRSHKFAQHGKAGTWLSELLPHTAKIADDLCVVKSLFTEAINHDPAITFIQTGSQVAGRPCFGSWVSLRARQRERRSAGVRRDDLARHRPAASTSRSTTACGAAAFCPPPTRA